VHLVGKLNAPDSQQFKHGEVETLIHCEGMELLRHLIQGHLDQRSAVESLREQVVGEDRQTPGFECGYYTEREASNIVVDPAARLTPRRYGEPLDFGFRRSGDHVYRRRL